MIENRPNLQQERSRETRDRVRNAAARVFARRGYGRATVDDIAQEAGVSKGALYHHFESKQEIFQSVLGDHSQEIDAMTHLFTSASSFRDVLRGLVGVWLDHYREDPDFMRLSLEFRLEATRDPEVGRILGSYYAGLRDQIAGLLRTGQSEGVVRDDLEPDVLAILVFALVDGAALQWGVDPERIDPERLRGPLGDAVATLLAVQGE